MQSILIIGMGSSGKAVYKNAMQNGMLPIIYDDKTNNKTSLENLIKNIDMVVVSPAIKPDHKIFILAKKYNKPIMGEIEYAYAKGLNKKEIIAVTGTNGKTTVCTMLKFILKNDYLLAGNIGIPATTIVDDAKTKCILELSSFQLMTTTKFKAHIACILNIKPDHIDYHKTFEEYKMCKLKIANNLQENDFLIINGDDKNIQQLNSKAKILKFSIKNKNADCYFDGKNIIIKDERVTQKINMGIFKGVLLHNIQNIMAFLLICKASKINPEIAVKNLVDYKYEPFRMQSKGMIKGKIIYNDSKSTNVASAISALQSLKNQKSICLILGGRYKHESFREIFKFTNLTQVIVYGESKNEIFLDAERENFANICKIENFEKVVKTALNSECNCILFSPACASFDMFDSYKQRGEVFDKLVERYNT